MFEITTLYGLVVAVIWMILWFRVRNMRYATKQSIGDGGNPDLLCRIRQHGNCVEWSTFLLILMILAEGQNAHALWLHVSGVLLVLGRATHPFGLFADRSGTLMRYVGNGSNVAAAGLLIVCLAVTLVQV
jgi:hypothetical protein